MVLFIDALFRVKDPPAELAGESFLSVDDAKAIRDVPPFRMEPTLVMVVTADGDIHQFTGDGDPKDLLSGLNAYLTSAPLSGLETCVGWHLDQTVIPALCASAVVHGVKFRRWMRRLDDKWSKTQALSMERALWQGWYSHSKFLGDDTWLTLDDALRMCGLTSLEDLRNDKDVKDMPPETARLLARVAGIAQLYQRYQEVLA